MESEAASVVDWLVGSKMCQGGDGLIRYGYGVTIVMCTLDAMKSFELDVRL